MPLETDHWMPSGYDFGKDYHKNSLPTEINTLCGGKFLIKIARVCFIFNNKTITNSLSIKMITKTT